MSQSSDLKTPLSSSWAKDDKTAETSSNTTESTEASTEQPKIVKAKSKGWAALRKKVDDDVEMKNKTAAMWRASVAAAISELKAIRQRRVAGTGTWMSINYIDSDNTVHREDLRVYTENKKSNEKHWEFALILSVGLATGAVTVVLLKMIELICGFKKSVVFGLWKTAPAAAWAILAASNALLFAGSVAINIYWKPTAAGSGIPEVKAYLNGIHLPGAFSKNTFIAKVISVICACASGLPVGPEGPIIYLGGNIGRFATSHKFLSYIPGLPYTNRLQRTAMTLGVSAGVGSAFSAPIGAVLFTVEEVASIFSSDMLWIGFICAFASYFVTILLGKDLFSGGEFSTAGMFDVGNIRQWQPQEIPCFIVLGFIMGLVGSLFTILNVTFINAKYRNKYVKKTKPRQMIEVIIIAVGLSTIWFFLPKVVPCMSKDKYFPENAGDIEKDLRESANSLWCESDEYNPLATLLFGSLEDVVKYLFAPDPEGEKVAFPPVVLLVYSFLFCSAACFIAGSAMATGLFIPMIVIGAGFGRSYGRLMQYILPHYVPDGFDVAGYAVAGAAGFLGGVTHITVAITVIMLEISADLRQLLPIMITCGIGKFTADHLTHPLFDMILEMRHIPFLEAEPTLAFQQLRCYQIMQAPVDYICCSSTVSDMCKALATSHNGFPVVESAENKKLMGIIGRTHLEVLLQNIEYFKEPSPDISNPTSPARNLSNHARSGAHKPSVDHKLTDEIFEMITEHHIDTSQHFDLRPWMNRAPISVRQLNAADRAFQIFKSYGLQHLPVVDSGNNLVGIITRHDLYCVQHHPEEYASNFNYQTEDFSQLRERFNSASSAPPNGPGGAARHSSGLERSKTTALESLDHPQGGSSSASPARQIRRAGTSAVDEVGEDEAHGGVPAANIGNKKGALFDGLWKTKRSSKVRMGANGQELDNDAEPQLQEFGG